MKKLILVLAAVTLSACSFYGQQSPYLPARDSLQAGETITVKNNENIYAVAREHNVSMRDLIVLNNLKPPYEVRPGQTLTMPSGSGSSFTENVMPAPQAAPLDVVDKTAIAPIEPAGVSSQPLSPVASSAPTPPPAATKSAIVSQPQALAPPQIVPAPAASSPKAATALEPVRELNRPSAPTPAPVTTTTTTIAPVAAPASDSQTISMIWPVQAPILSTFGSKGAGLNNDGVNIGAPKDAPVVAAASGTVVYAGNEMKGFGNLVLIRHEGDWVTAYAHLDRVLVKKDSIVGQGDMIGTVGKTGNVPSPQLHFETRHGDKAVDPASIVKDQG